MSAPQSDRHALALTNPCPVCGAAVGDECGNTITPGAPLPGRAHHIGRLEGYRP